MRLLKFPLHVLVGSLFLFASCDTGTSSGASGNKGTALSRILGNSYDADAFATAMQTSWGNLPADTASSGQEAQKITAEARRIYEEASYMPLWIDEDGEPRTEELIADLEASISLDGLPGGRYPLTQIRDAPRDFGKIPVDSAVRWDRMCTEAYLRAASDLTYGVLLPRQADSLWYHPNDSGRSLPAASDFRQGYVSLDSFRSRLPEYGHLRRFMETLAKPEDSSITHMKEKLRSGSVPDSSYAALIRQQLPDWEYYAPDTLSGDRQVIAGFQQFRGLKPSGKSDSSVRRLLLQPADSTRMKVAANLERLRWLPRQAEAEYVRVNIPEMTMRYMRGETTELQMRAVVGKPARQTPVLTAPMENVVFNPPWGVPPTIAKNDVLPGITRSGGAYLARKGLKAYTRSGKEVSAGGIHAGNLHKFIFRQPPGPRNALGEIKFNMPNKWDIYLHDTPHDEDFVKRYRALSSGCIRLEEPKTFAEFILVQKEAKNQFGFSGIDSVIHTRKTKFENLKHKIPVHILYLTADGVGGKVQFYDDIYKRDKKLIRLLTSAA